MKASEIRKKFFKYFTDLGHTQEPSASLIPYNDKTLLFVNSGMVPFKDVFSGVEKRNYTKAVSAQICIRAGGKHNDLENVGYTARHHTFFEMLGNFSFGDYFKKEAIAYAWDFLTKELQIPADKMWVSVYENDDEAESIWVNDIGFPKNKISRRGAKDNFWSMGDTGPCGPCSEIFYDHGSDIAGGPPGHADEDGDRFTEIWNLVFTQFDRQADGHLKPLKRLCVDTGMGLERISAVMQNKNNNYDIDLFQSLIKFIAKLANTKQDNSSVRVIADHIRSSAFLIANGVMPDNEGRGYVLRRIIRRAIRHGYKLGINKVFFHRLAPILTLEMGSAYPMLKQQLAHIEKTLKQEEQRFLQTITQGMDILADAISKLDSLEIPGYVAFKLYDTYGFPVDLTADIAKERGLTIDMAGFDNAMDVQKQQSKEASNFTQNSSDLALDKASIFLGYEQNFNNSKVIKIIKNNTFLDSLSAGEEAILVLAGTVFYAEAGGQVGDIGNISVNNTNFKVLDTKKQKFGVFLHYGLLDKGTIKIGDNVKAQIDKNRRKNIARNHSATHLLHASLKQILGENITQKGSLVDSDKLRFDFTYDNNISGNDLDKIEAMVNRKILGNSKVYTEIMPIDTAKKKGAIALFGEKYDQEVRVLSMGKNDFSMELCGGTHVSALGDIGGFKIISETGVASGVRRIEAITGYTLYLYNKKLAKQLNNVAKLLKTDNWQSINKLTQLITDKKNLEKQLQQLNTDLSLAKGNNLFNSVQTIGDIKLLSAKLDNITPKDLRNIVDKAKNKLGNAIILLASVNNNKVSLIAGVSKNLTDKYKAYDILNFVAKQIDGKGGGRADMAQGSGSNTDNLDQALASIKSLISL